MADLTHDTADDAFHEIHLSGKQLVFLFMATTVISVIIFICGVLVGRRVAAQELEREDRAPAVTDASPGDTNPAPATTPPVPVSEAPPPDYQGRLEGQNPPRPETLKPVAEEPPAAPPQPQPEPTAAAPPGRAAEEKPEPARAETGTAGARPGVWAVQVVSLRDRAAAMQLVQRLKGKGYPAYLVPPAAGAPALYKVQVGRYKDRSEATQIDAKLKKEEQFKTWIVR